MKANINVFKKTGKKHHFKYIKHIENMKNETNNETTY